MGTCLHESVTDDKRRRFVTHCAYQRISRGAAGERGGWAGNPSQHHRNASSPVTFYSFQFALAKRGPNLSPFHCSLLHTVRKKQVRRQEFCVELSCWTQPGGQRLGKKGGLDEWLTGLERCVPCLSSVALNFNHRCVNLIVNHKFWNISLRGICKLILRWSSCSECWLIGHSAFADFPWRIWINRQ